MFGFDVPHRFQLVSQCAQVGEGGKKGFAPFFLCRVRTHRVGPPAGRAIVQGDYFVQFIFPVYPFLQFHFIALQYYFVGPHPFAMSSPSASFPRQASRTAGVLLVGITRFGFHSGATLVNR